MLQATLRLFNAIQIQDEDRKLTKVSDKIAEKTIKQGYLIDPSIKTSNKILSVIGSIVGVSGEKANASFHKSWAVVRDTPMEILAFQQILHYITTYGLESLGLYSEDTIYIPHEKLEIPEVENDIPLVVIKGLTSEEILDKIVSLGSGIALAQETLNDIMTIIEENKYSSSFVEKIGNRELKALLYDHYGIVPSDPVEFLRHLISKLTDESLVIKNDVLIEKIKTSNGKFLDELMRKAPEDLATIFFRYKPLFLAMKSISKNKTFFNRLRKQAKKMHKPLPVDYLNSVTSQIKQDALDLGKLKDRLVDASIFRKTRLAYALKYRLNADDSIVYRVRNGRGWATKFQWDESLNSVADKALSVVLESIADTIRPNVEGKTIYIPSNVYYALPATEKQFTGHFPSGTYVTVPEDMIAGIHWTNTNKRVDLDLSAMDTEGKIGWDSDYRRGDGILFSGDVTSAPKPNGASELFYFKKGSNPKIMTLNYFNFSQGDEVNTKILVAQKKIKSFEENYMVDPNHIIASTNVNISKEQNVLGLIISIDGVTRFCFANVSVGNSITASVNEKSMQARSYLMSSFADPLDFREVLIMAGANIVDEQPEDDHIDLSPSALNKTTIIDLIQPPVNFASKSEEEEHTQEVCSV